MTMTPEKNFACDDIIEALSKDILSKWADPKKASPRANKWGIDVFWSQKNPGNVRLVFMTKDWLEVDFLFEFSRLKAEGYEKYIKMVVEIITSQLDAARAEKQHQDAIMLFPEKNPVAEAVQGAADNDTALALPKGVH